MNTVNLERRPFDEKVFLRKVAAEADTQQVFTEPGVYCVDGKPAIIYAKLNQRYDEMLWAVKNLPFHADSRSTAGGALGTRNREKLGESKIFGFRPRIPYGANYCSISSTAVTHPKQHNIICEFGLLLNHIYETCAPETAALHSKLLSECIRPDWILPGTRFTSGIANRNNPLKYHFDKGNLENVMSCMVVFRRGCEGGYLSIPEFDARWMLDDHSVLLFDGQSFLHGVTPIKRLNKNAYRYSVVYYALKALGKCGTLDEELTRARIEKREREKRRV